MTTIKLTYFDFPGGRGEDCRLALFIAGVDFEDDRVGSKAWPERKPGTPYGAMPVLEIEGLGQLAQSNTILRYLGRKYDLHPIDEWEAARHEALMCAVEDLRAAIIPTFRIEDDGERKKAREELADGYIQRWAANVEKQLGDGPYLGGHRINVVDLKLFVVMTWFISGKLDHIRTNVFEKHPKLLAHYEAVKTHPKVVEWYSRGSS